jgi:hypothetical protein
LGPDEAADTAASQLAGDISAESSDLGEALLGILPEVFLGLLLA